MVGKIFRRPRAEDDLFEIWVFIASDNEPAATRLLDRLDRAMRTLADMSRVGRLRDDLSAGLRSHAVGNYTIFYTPLDDGIEVVRVLSAFRDIDPQMIGRCRLLVPTCSIPSLPTAPPLC